MGSTSLGITYPDPAGVPSRSALQSLATTTDSAIKAHVASRVQAGTQTVPAGTGGALETVSVTFPVAFAVAPVVSVNAVVADPALYPVTAVASSATGFQIKVRRGAGATLSFPVTWIAVAP